MENRFGEFALERCERVPHVSRPLRDVGLLSRPAFAFVRFLDNRSARNATRLFGVAHFSDEFV